MNYNLESTYLNAERELILYKQINVRDFDDSHKGFLHAS